MDPDANLAELLELAADLAEQPPAPAYRHAVQLAQMVLELDTWLTAGGFLPARWQPAIAGSARAV